MAFDPDAYLAKQPQGFDPDAYLASQPTEQPMQAAPGQPQGGVLEAIYEPAAAIATGIPAEIAAGWSGLISAPFTGTKEAAENVEETRRALTYQPKTRAGQEALAKLGEYFETGVQALRYPLSGIAGLTELATGQGIEQAAETVRGVQERGLGETAGLRTLEETGSPEAAAAVETAIKGAPAVLPIAKMFKTRSAMKAKIADQIMKGETDKSLAKYMLKGQKSVKIDPIAKETIKQGFDEGVVAAVKGASINDKAKMLKMVNILKKGKENALYAMKNRPTDVAGNSLLERVNHIKKINRDAGMRLDSVAKSLKGKSIDSKTPINNFIQNLDDMGIQLSDDLKPVFVGSDIEQLAGPQAAIKNIIKRLKSGKRGVMPDAYDLHRLKKYIDENVTYGKGGEGLKGKTENVLKQLRRDIDSTLDANFSKYDKVNTTYSDTINALDSLQNVAGKKMDLFGPNADKAVGTLLRRMMSNAQSRVNLIDSVDDIERISRKYGGKFKDDISTQMLFADELDTVFGPTARTSLAGETVKGIRRGAEVATGQKTAMGAVLETGAAGMEKLRGINEANALKSISDLLVRK
jgi:hypothetical protein